MDLTISEALILWWSGQQISGHSLHGVPVLWLGRAGKLAAFLAGTTIVLDLIGPQRLVEWGEAVQARARSSTSMWFTWVCGGGALILGVVANTAAVPIGEAFFERFAWMGQWMVVVFYGLGIAMTAAVICAGVLAERYGPRAVVHFGRLLARPRFERWWRAIAVPLFFVGFALDYLAS
ncbi:hypothetical protein [Marinactinospora rubrisoli]|uniref:Uncharacterized protein n=1 Tax=Marinactinospora rubrisoli TaxID=2715399 RepID=A0ABW2KB59_9ACTN